MNNVDDEETIILASRESHAAHGVVHLCINLWLVHVVDKLATIQTHLHKIGVVT